MYIYTCKCATFTSTLMQRAASITQNPLLAKALILLALIRKTDLRNRWWPEVMRYQNRTKATKQHSHINQTWLEPRADFNCRTQSTAHRASKSWGRKQHCHCDVLHPSSFLFLVASWTFRCTTAGFWVCFLDVDMWTCGPVARQCSSYELQKKLF